ncbi:MAG: TolC family protein [Ehrlichia sp.]
MIKFRMYRIFYLAIFIISIVSTNGYCTDLNQALHTALTNNPHIKAKFYTSLENKQKITLNGISKFLPSLVCYFSIRQPDLSFSSDNKIARFTVSQQIFNGGADAAAFRQSKHLVNIEEINFLIEKQNILLNTVNAYMKVLTTAEVYKLTQHTQKSIYRTFTCYTKTLFFRRGNKNRRVTGHC